MKRKIAITYVFCFLFTSFFNLTFSQTNNIPYCPYTFSKNLSIGSQDYEVYILQQILNSDKRTLVAKTGVGSLGNESLYFGPATREALKRFQALFIEYIGIADGKFAGKTREFMQNICNGTQKKVEKPIQTNIITNTSTNTTLPLSITLTTTANIFYSNTDIRIFLISNQEIISPTPDSFIINGASIKEIRKLKKTEFLIILSPADDSNSIDIQIESEKISTINKILNEKASNELVLKLIGGEAPKTPATTSVSTMNSALSNLNQILNSIIPSPSIFSTQNTNPVSQNSTNNTSQATQSGGNNSSKSGGNSISKILENIFGSNKNSQNGGGINQNNPNQYTPGPGAPAYNSNQVNEPSQLEKLRRERDVKCAKGSDDKIVDEAACGIAAANFQAEEEKVKEMLKSCSAGNGTDSEIRNLLKVAGISERVGSGFGGMPRDTVIMLKELETDCKCKITITSATRVSSATPQGAHGPGKRVVDLAFTGDLTNYIKSKGGGPCWYTIKGVRFLDEQRCPSANATGAHWHVDGTGWKCGG